MAPSRSSIAADACDALCREFAPTTVGVVARKHSLQVTDDLFAAAGAGARSDPAATGEGTPKRTPHRRSGRKRSETSASDHAAGVIRR